MNETLEQVAVLAGLDQTDAVCWRRQWDESGATFSPGAAEQFYLQPAWIEQTGLELDWPADVRAALRAGLDLFQRQPALRRLAWHCRHLLYVAPAGNMAAELQKWPALPSALHPAADLFYAYVFLAGLPLALARHRELGVPPAVTRATFSDLPLWLRDYREKHGRWGLRELQGTGWLYSHLCAKLFRLGRLQFQFEVFRQNFRIYRRVADGQTIMLAGPGQVIRPDGRFDGANGIFAGADAWTTAWPGGSGGLAGHPVDPRGFIRRAVMTLDPADWQGVLASGDPVLGIHIPAGEPLTPDACGASLSAAAEFFPKYFPASAARVFTCATWLFDAQFEQYLPPNSNIVQFLRQFYLFPVPGANDRQTLERVCGRGFTAPADMPRKTSLQRVVADHMAAGGRWYLTGGFLLMDDVARWGRAPYRAGTG